MEHDELGEKIELLNKAIDSAFPVKTGNPERILAIHISDCLSEVHKRIKGLEDRMGIQDFRVLPG